VAAWNRGARRIFGLAEEEAIGRTLLDFLAPEEGPNGRMWLSALACGRSVRNVETHGLDRDGRRFPMLLTATAVRGAPAGFLGAVVIKELAELRALQDKTLEAERLTTILETVVSVNHEINNPLAIVMGNLQLLLRQNESGPPQSRAQTRAALSAARRIAEVIRRLSGIVEPVEMEYLRGRGIPMLDIRRSRTR
jgi:PAS domain S-box-containing protein